MGAQASSGMHIVHSKHALNFRRAYRKLLCCHKSYLGTTSCASIHRFGCYQPTLLAPLWGPGTGGQSEQAEKFEATVPCRLISLRLQTSRVRARSSDIRGRRSWMQCDCNRNLPREECSEQLAIQDLQLQLPSRQSSCPRGNVVASRQCTFNARISRDLAMAM